MAEEYRGVKALRKRDIKPLGITFMLYCLVSAGCFGIEEMIPAAGPGFTLILLIVFPIIWSLPISNCVAECSALMPVEGGVYTWAKKAFGEFWGFLAGWWSAIDEYISTGTYIALMAAYTSQIFAFEGWEAFLFKAAVILIFTLVNLVGIKSVERSSDVMSVIVLLMFAVIAVIGFVNWQTDPFEPMTAFGTETGDLGSAIFLCMWMYCGYESISTIAGEVKDRRAIPKGLMIALPLVAISYILPTMAAIACLPEGSWELWAVDGGLVEGTIGYASVLNTYLGSLGSYIFLGVAIISNCSIFNVYLASGSRRFFMLADDNLFTPKFQVLHKKYRTPHVGIISLAIVSLLFAQFEFATIVELEMAFLLVIYIFTGLITVKLRKMYPIEDRKKDKLYVIPGGKFGLYFSMLLPILLSLAALWINGLEYMIYAVIGLSTGPLFYVIFKRRYGGLTVNDPENYPIDPKTKLGVGDGKRIGQFFMMAGGVLAVSAILALLGIA
ncbi:MAG: APC family permease [Eggerthellaceae bacterium]|nr:APC family permease [Eggerthellaceae bacterium]